MKPPAFAYHAPTSLQEALDLLGRYGGAARIMAGGQSLMPMLNMRRARPDALVDLNRIAELAYIQAADGALRVGAMTRQRAAERSPVVREHAPPLAETVSWIGHIPIRNRGTIGGSMALAHPAAELPALARALDAQFVVSRAGGGERRLDAGEFFVGALATALHPDEILTEIRFPRLAPRTGWAVQEIAPRQNDLALVGAIALVTLDEAGRCADVRLGLFGVGETPVRAAPIERRLAGQIPDPQTIRAVMADLPGLLDPPSDMHASAAYRREAAVALAGRAIAKAARRAWAGPRAGKALP